MSENKELNQPQDETKIKESTDISTLKPWLIAITVILFLMLTLNAYQFVQNISADQRKEELINTADSFFRDIDCASVI